MIHSMQAPRRRVWSAALVVLAGLTVTLAWSGTAGAATFGPPVIITGDHTGEPGINIAPDGTIYVNAPAGFLSDLPGSPSVRPSARSASRDWSYSATWATCCALEMPNPTATGSLLH